MPLADATDVPTEGEIELQNEVEVASELTSLTSSRAASNVDQAQSISAPLTNGSELTSLSRSTSLLSSLSSLPDLAPTSPQSNKSTPFRSIISTRRQKAKEAATSASASNVQLVSPPLTDDTVSVVEHPSTPSKRLTRSVSSLVTYGKNGRKRKGKASSLSTPTPKSDKGKGKEEVKVKKEETEPRIVRGRPSLPANPSETTKETAPVREIPKGPDGKPLPICATCSNVLPLIHVDSKVVWGSEVDSPSKSKKKRQDCPRWVFFDVYPHDLVLTIRSLDACVTWQYTGRHGLDVILSPGQLLSYRRLERKPLLWTPPPGGSLIRSFPL